VSAALLWEKLPSTTQNTTKGKEYLMAIGKKHNKKSTATLAKVYCSGACSAENSDRSGSGRKNVSWWMYSITLEVEIFGTRQKSILGSTDIPVCEALCGL
jgi:hypothetical protein